MQGEVVRGAGADGRGRGVDGAGDDLRVRRQPEFLGRRRREPAEHLGALHDLRQLVAVDTAIPHQAGVVLHAVRVAVVGHPAGHDRVVARGHAAGELEVQVVGHVEELVRALVDLGQLVADVQHVRGGVLARRRGHATGELHPAPDPWKADALHAERPAELPAQVRRAAHVHPEDAVRERRAGLVDRHRALALGAAAHRGDIGGRTRRAASRRRAAATTARHQSSGRCSAPPPGSTISSTGSNSHAATRPSMPMSATLAPDVPRSTARTYREALEVAAMPAA